MNDFDNDLNAITRLERSENFDGNLEDIHAALSKRDSIRQSCRSNSTSLLAEEEADKEQVSGFMSKGEGKGNNADGRKFSDKAQHTHSTRRLLSSSSEIEKDKDKHRRRRSQSQSRQQKYNSRTSMSELSSRNLKEESSRHSMPDLSSSRNLKDAHHRHRRQSRRRVHQKDESQRSPHPNSNNDTARPVRSASVIEELLQYDNDDNQSVADYDKNNSNSHMSIPTLSHHSSSSRLDAEEDDGVRSKRKSVERRRRSRSTSVTQQQIQHRRGSSRRPNGSKNYHHRRSSSQQPQQQHRNASREDNQSNQVDQIGTSSKRSLSLRSDVSLNHHVGLQGEKIDEKKYVGSSKKSNERINSLNSNSRANEGSIYNNIPSSPGRSERTKKTKLEKIHELLAKCDRYKKEWKDAVTDVRRYRKDLEDSRSEIVSLKKTAAANDCEVSLLQTKLSETLVEFNTMQNQHRTELSDTVTELSKVTIDHATLVDETRALQSEINRFNEILTGRDETIFNLEEELNISAENTKQLEADILFADDQIKILEKKIKIFEQEVATYTKVIHGESISNNNGDKKEGTTLEETMHETTTSLDEERGKQLDEKQRILEEDMRLFEERRRKQLREKKKTEDLFLDQQIEIEEQIARKEEEMKGRLKTLQDENTALNGRLKSEQLDSAMKLNRKDNKIDELRTELDRFTNEQRKRDSDPDSSSSLLTEIEILNEDVKTGKKDFQDAQMKKIDLQNRVNDLEVVNKEMMQNVSNLQLEIANQKKEVDNYKRKTIEWQKKSGEWSDKAFKWKEKSEQLERKTKDSYSVSESDRSSDKTQTEPQASFLAAAVEKKATTNINGSGSNWRLGGIFTKPSENEDDTQALISKLENENNMYEKEIKTLKSEMIKLRQKFKEEAYNKEQQFKTLQKEKEATDLTNTNLLSELELARKLNQTISKSDHWGNT